MSVISTIIGGGIISVPYAMSAPGFVHGIQINLCILVFMVFCTHLYLEARDRLGF